MQQQEIVRHAADAAAGTGAFMAVMGWLEPVMAVLASTAAIAWYVIQGVGAWRRRNQK